MELYTLNINVNKQRLSFGENKPEIFSGDQSIDFVEFTFEDAMWNFPDIWAIFSRQKGTSYQVALEDNKVMIPAEVMQKRGYVYIGLMATDGENVQTSSVLQYSIGQGSTNVDAITPSASIYEQFLADLDAYQTAVADLDDIESRITTAEGNVSMIEQAVTDLNEQLDGINVDISTINGQITTIQNNIGTAQGDIVSIQNGINALNGQVAGLDTAVGTLSNRVTALQSSVTSLEGRLTTVGNTLTDFEGRLTTAGTTLTNLEGSISDAENDIQTVQGDIETIQSDIEDIQTAIEQNNVVTDVTAEGISLVDNHIADLSFMCVTDTASGDVASFPDGSGVAMKKAEVSLEPIQDLHGYDKPWPGGGGKNKWNYDVNINDSVYPHNISLSLIQPVLEFLNAQIGKTVSWSAEVTGTASGAADIGQIRFLNNSTNVLTLNNGGSKVIPDFDFTTISSVIIYGSTNGATIKNCQLELASAPTAYAPYENICPIDGYEDVGVSVVGKNWLTSDYNEYIVGASYLVKMNILPENVVARMTFTDKDTSIDASGCYLGFIQSDFNYTVAGSPTYFRWCLQNGVASQNLTNVDSGGSNVRLSGIFIYPKTQEAFDKIFSRYNVMVELGSTATAYEPYARTDYTTDLGRTVYGGDVEQVGGVLTDRFGFITFDGTEAWTAFGTGFLRVISDMKIGRGQNGITNFLPTVNNSSTFGAFFGADNQVLYLPKITENISDVTDVTTWQAYLANNPLQVCYPLATPQTYQLTPQQIQTLIGTNNVWSEDGAIEVEYIANLKDYIDKKINA